MAHLNRFWITPETIRIQNDVQSRSNRKRHEVFFIVAAFLQVVSVYSRILPFRENKLTSQYYR